MMRLIDRLPMVPMWIVMTLGVVMAANALLKLTVDAWNPPARIGLTLLVAFMALLWRGARAEQQRKAKSSQ